MKTITTKLGLGLALVGLALGWSVAASAESGCVSCHKGIEEIRDPASPMMAMIKGIGAGHGDSEGCIVCHGGNPKETSDKNKAHSGSPAGLKSARGPQTFYPDPGAMDINKFTCGQAACHQG